MISLKKISGLPILYDEKRNILISKKIKIPKPGIRTLREMRKVLLDKVDKPNHLYFMYRDVHFSKDNKLLKNNDLRYDITVIPPNKLGQEWVKTAGHYHGFVPGTDISYPEVYEVLNGTASYLLQKERKGKIVDVICIKAKKGCKVVVPPGYGHITINASDEVLIMSNWVSTRFSSIYDPILKKQGGAYFGISDKGRLKFIKNKKYQILPRLKSAKSNFQPKFGLFKNKPMYVSFLENPNSFRFLNFPQNFTKEFKDVIK